MALFPCCDFTLFLCNLHQAGGEVAMGDGKTVHTRCLKEIEQMGWVPLGQDQ